MRVLHKEYILRPNISMASVEFMTQAEGDHDCSKLEFGMCHRQKHFGPQIGSKRSLEHTDHHHVNG